MALGKPNVTERQRIIQEICHSNLDHVSNTHFDAFMRFYASIFHGRQNTFAVSIQNPVFETHADVIEAILLLRRNATLSKSSFQDQAFGDAEELEKEYAARLAVKVAFMIDCASKDDFSDGYKLHGSFPVKWAATQSFIEFLECAFPTTETRPFHARPSNRSMKAWKLKKRNGIRFIPTNDLVQHLLYDPQASTIKVFHQAAFIKAQLWHTGKLPLDTKFGESVQMYVAIHNLVTWTPNRLRKCAYSGSLPPQLLLETLLTLYYILFPLSIDQKSAKLARSLVRKRRFDPNLMIDDGSIRVIPADFKYVYWGERLRVLEAITANPPPGNKIVSWMERHTSERNALTVAIIGVFLAVLFGFLGFIVGIAQLVISVLAWKYPVA